MSAVIDFAVPALLVSGAAMVALLLARDAPPRLGLWIAMLGLAAWVVPWPLIDFPVLFSSTTPAGGWLAESAAPIAVLKHEARGLLDAASTTLGAPPAQRSAGAVWWLALLVPGLVWFAIECALYRRRVRDWRRGSRDGADLRRLLPAELAARAPRIRVVSGSAIAATTGLLRPVVWIGERIGDERALRAALIHECCHAHARDPLWLALIVLVGRLHWWNPAVAVLARRAGLLLEAACDRDCARLLGQARYRKTLAELMLRAHEHREAQLAPMLCTPSMNVRRLERLERNVRMGWRAYAAVALCAAAGIAAAGPEAIRDPRLGRWIEVSNSSPSSPILRSFEDRGGGSTRVNSFVGPDGTALSWSDHRCDGRRYPVMNERGEQVQLTLSCVIRDHRTVEFAFHRTDGSGQVDRGIEWISSDGGTYTVTFETVDGDGHVLQTVQRQFWRLE
jgi:hypothetical protein